MIKWIRTSRKSFRATVVIVLIVGITLRAATLITQVFFFFFLFFFFFFFTLVTGPRRSLSLKLSEACPPAAPTPIGLHAEPRA